MPLLVKKPTCDDVHLTMAIDDVLVSYDSSPYIVASHTSINHGFSQLQLIATKMVLVD